MADDVPSIPEPSAADLVRRGRMLVVRGEPEGRPDQPEAPHLRRALPQPRPGAAGPVGAQLLGERQRRGLRAGPEVLEQARATYLQTEYAGPRDRRPRKGQVTRTEV